MIGWKPHIVRHHELPDTGRELIIPEQKIGQPRSDYRLLHSCDAYASTFRTEPRTNAYDH